MFCLWTAIISLQNEAPRLSMAILKYYKATVPLNVQILNVNTLKRVRREEKPTRCHWMFYCTYSMLNMFRAPLYPSSGARDYMCVITAYGVPCLGCWCSEVRCRTAGYASGMKNVAWLEQYPSFRAHILLLCTWPSTTSDQDMARHRR